MISAEQALERLRRGNHDFVTVRQHERDLSPERVASLYEYGQNPFAVVVACSDSRTVPEHMFMMGLGDLFVVRVAGNVVGPVELASVVYACEHLGVKLALVLGHTGCGAIEAAMQKADAQGEGDGAAHATSNADCADGARAAASHADCADGMRASHGEDGVSNPLDALTDPIGVAIGDERDPYRASELNVRAGMAALAACPQLRHLQKEGGLRIAGAIYHTHSGEVDFLPE